MVFDHTGDHIEFDVVYNSDMLIYFVDRCNDANSNEFCDGGSIAREVSQLLQQTHSAVTMTNPVISDLVGISFDEHTDLLRYLDQAVLNRQHAQWVDSQRHTINIDNLRFSEQTNSSRLGWQLHEQYPDCIRDIGLAEAMAKLGFAVPYDEVNLAVHRLEGYWTHNIEYKNHNKWQVFDNPCLHSMISNNDVVNFGFGYTYVGRQYYDKWQFYDSNLEHQDNYNYETLEYAFQINLDRPQTIPFSQEFMTWCDAHGVPAVARQVPIANAVDIDKNLRHYRQILYTNSLAQNPARLHIH